MPSALPATADLLCFLDHRWAFVFHRPQHLMTRFARARRVFVVEAPEWIDGPATASVSFMDGVHVVVPQLPREVGPDAAVTLQRRLLHAVMIGYAIERPIAWLYNPMAWPLLEGLSVSMVVYDCMDDPAALGGGATDIRAYEAALLDRADVVFTAGYSLYEAKRAHRANVHPVPSSVDARHFARAGRRTPVPLDQQRIARLRLGFAGVIDDRLDFLLLAGLARRRPDWQLVMIGPVAGIDLADLPRAPNIHYLGPKRYEELPDYFAGWDVALVPYAHNDATRFSCPIKTAEYLAAGCPVISTSIRDVVRPYGEEGFVQIADTVDELIGAVTLAMTPGGRAGVRRAQTMLATMSWDRTYEEMCEQLDAARRMPPPAVAS
jgi:UDP-galactopyranose mutase